MSFDNNTISVNYTDENLRTLVEEFITVQKQEFTFKDLCSYVLYWAKEEGRTANNGLYASNELDTADGKRLNQVLKKIVGEGRISILSEDNESYMKTNE